MEMDDPGRRKPEWKVAADIIAAHLFLVGGTALIFALKDSSLLRSLPRNGIWSFLLSAFGWLLLLAYAEHILLPTLRGILDEASALFRSAHTLLRQLSTKRRQDSLEKATHTPPLEQEMQLLQEQHVTLEQAYTTLQDAYRTLQNEHDTLRQDYERLQLDAQTFSATIHTLESERDTLHATAIELQRYLDKSQPPTPNGIAQGGAVPTSHSASSKGRTRRRSDPSTPPPHD